MLLSGGQDSTTCLYWAIDRYGAENVETVTFDYGQRHRIELQVQRGGRAFRLRFGEEDVGLADAGTVLVVTGLADGDHGRCGGSRRLVSETHTLRSQHDRFIRPL